MPDLIRHPDTTNAETAWIAGQARNDNEGRATTPDLIRGRNDNSLLDFLKHNFREYGMLLSLVAIMVFFQVMTDGTLMQPLNVTNLVLQNSYIVIMALGMLLVIVAGHIDLSVGSVCGFIGALAAVLMVQYDWHFVPASLACLVCGAVIGGAQGWFVAYFRIPSFIVTLAGMLVFKGLALALLHGQSVGPFPDSFQMLSSGFIPDFSGADGLRMASLMLGAGVAAALAVAGLRARANQHRHGMEVEPTALLLAKTAVFGGMLLYFSYLMASYKGLPNVLVVMALLILAFDFITTRTTIGRRIYALGGNEKAARLSGIKTERLTFYAFANMGVLAALAGLVFAARLNTATPKAGLGFELDVIAACFIGGASASGGVGRVMGAVIGAFIMGVMNNGMSILGVGIDYQQVIKGLVLLAAVLVDVYNKNKA
jgi:putative multiple sugar transport system permease protein